MNKLPKARSNNFVVQETANELLVYDLITNKAFCLNETAAIIFNACDGETSFNEINRRHNFTDELIFLTLDSLKTENLLDENFHSPFDRVKRREVIKKIGLATMMALPLISSVIAPKAVNAQSDGIGILGTCPNGSGCQPGLTCRTCTSGCFGESMRCCSGGSVFPFGNIGIIVGMNLDPVTCSNAADNTCCSGRASNVAFGTNCLLINCGF